MINYEEELKRNIFNITRYEVEINKDKNIYRYQRENISDEIENIFSEYNANKLNNKKLHYNIATSLTIEFTAKDVINKIKKDKIKYDEKQNEESIINLSEHNKTTFKPDLIIYKKEKNKNIILAFVEFKNDLGYTREMFGKKDIEKDINITKNDDNKTILYKDKQYKEIYKDKYHKGNKNNLEQYYGYKRKYIMELLNNVGTYNITSKRRINNTEETEIYEIVKPCKTYILACSCSNSSINDIKALYIYDFVKNNENKYVKFNTFFKESIRLDEKINKDKTKFEEITLTLDDDETLGYKRFIDDLKEDINNKI